jgi:hypothetical protein
MKNLASYLTHILHKWNVPILAIAVAFGIVRCCSSAFAQSGAGSIEGTVTDSTDAVIPGAAIHIVNQATSVATDTKSNAVGFYQVPSLFTGTYVVTVTAPNMKSYKTTIQLLVAQTAVINPVMTAGTVTEQVEVAANAVQLTTTDSGSITSTLENERINQLPMNGRVLFTLAGETTPGLEGQGMRINGLMPEALEYVADGAPLVNRNYGGAVAAGTLNASLPDPDAVQEVQMETTNASAQYAAPATGVITTKSGTNSLHGSLFETARNNAVGIAKARSDPSNLVAPSLVRNEFGISVGGPIILPHVYHGKTKSFWFFAYERYSNAHVQNNLATVPAAAWRKGDFSQLYNSAGVLQQLYDPETTGSPLCNHGQAYGQYCRLPFPNNQIPIGRLSPSSKILYDIIPKATSLDNPLVTSNYTQSAHSFVVIPTITFRLDHSFNENNKVYLRYTQNVQNNLSQAPSATVAADGFPANANGEYLDPVATFSAAIGYTHVFSPTFFSETIVSQQWQGTKNTFGGDPFTTNYEQKLGLPNNFGEKAFPAIGASTVMPLIGSQNAFQESQIITTLDENLTKTLGRHQIQFGARYRHERFGNISQSQDSTDFSGLATALENPESNANYLATGNTGNANADVLSRRRLHILGQLERAIPALPRHGVRRLFPG